MELNIGDYVRTKKGIIGKIKAIDNQTELEDLYLIKKTWYYKEYIIKSSPNIIDLIEVGDILSFEDKSICRIIEISNGYYLLKNYGGEQYYESKEWIKDFKSIVTKEQFESMEYKI